MKHLVLYDGDCGFCNKSILFILSRDTVGLFAFAPLGGVTAEQYLEKSSQARSADTLILIENFQTTERKIYIESQAVFRIGKELGGVWSFLGKLEVFPRAVFDPLYRLVARHRHKIFGYSACMIPEPKYRARFLP